MIQDRNLHEQLLCFGRTCHTMTSSSLSKLSLQTFLGLSNGSAAGVVHSLVIMLGSLSPSELMAVT